MKATTRIRPLSKHKLGGRSMSYPMVKPWLEYRETKKDEYEIENFIAVGEPVHLPSYVVSFMQHLDGKTNPYAIDPSLDKQTVKALLRYLSKQGFLREKGRNRDLGRFVVPVVLFDSKPKPSRILMILNRCFMLSWLPVLLIGFFFAIRASDMLDSSNAYLFGLIFGLIGGLIVHEVGHAIAARAYMAPVYEIGIQVLPLPSAYTFMKETTIKNRFKRTQIYAAGVEMNFLLTGICFILAYFIPHDWLCTFLFYVAIENFILGVSNLSFFLPLDGFKIINTILGADDMAWSMALLFVSPVIWKEQLQKGPSGLARILCIIQMLFMQSVAIIWLLYAVAVIFL